MKTTPEMFESGTVPPYSEVAKTGHDKIFQELADLIAQRRRRVIANRKKEEKKQD